MNYYYITGTSKGIGEALTKALLKDENNFVTGISRKENITHPRYHHYDLDLRDLDAVKKVNFNAYKDTEMAVLINNAGVLGEIIQIGKLNPDNIIDTFNVNIVSAAVLTNAFIRAYKNMDIKKLVINISSGAGRQPVASWATYCASKAALDMFSETVAAEQLQKTVEYPTRIFSVAPGIVDTQMQEELRTVKSKYFAEVDKFIAFKEQGLLATAEQTAEKIILLINNSEQYPNVVLDIKNLSIC